MSEGDGNRGPKRKLNDKKKYYSSKRKRSNQLEAGLTGFLVTCNYNEKRCLMECYDLLNHYADKLGIKGESQPVIEKDDEEEVEEEEDFDAAFNKEVEMMKNKTDTKDRLFQQVVTNAKNILFIRAKMDSEGILAMMDAILGDMKAGNQKGARHILRMLPVIGTCRVDLDKLKALASTCLKPHFGNSTADSNADSNAADSNAASASTGNGNSDSVVDSEASKTNADTKSDGTEAAPSAATTNASAATAASPPPPRTFNIDFKTRHNGGLDRFTTLREVSSVIQSLDSRNLVEYDDPDFTVAVEVVGKTLCLALTKNYKANKKYNLQQFNGNHANQGHGNGHGGASKSTAESKNKSNPVSEDQFCDREKKEEKDEADKNGDLKDDGPAKDEFGYRAPIETESAQTLSG